MKKTMIAMLAVAVLAGGARAGERRADFDLKLPCTVLDLDRDATGGSLGGLLLGADGDTLAFAWAGTLLPRPSPSPVQDAGRVRRIYIGARDWRDAHAAALAVGSPEEEKLIEALQGWVDTVIPVDDQEKLYGDALAPAYSDPAWRQARAKLSDQEFRALEVARLVKILERQRETLAPER